MYVLWLQDVVLARCCRMLIFVRHVHVATFFSVVVIVVVAVAARLLPFDPKTG